VDELAEGRAALAGGRPAIALEHLAAAAETGDPGDRAVAMALAAEVNLDLDRPHEALDWLERLRDDAGPSDRADLLEAVARVRLGDGGTALGLLDGLADPGATGGGPEAAARLVLRSRALGLVDRTADAVAAVLAALREDAADPHAWGQLATLLDRDPAAPVTVPDLPAARFPEVAQTLLAAPPAGTDRILEAQWARRPRELRVIALLAHLGPALPVPRALEWSARMRAAGHAEHCPLLGLAANRERPAPERLRAAAIAAAGFGDERAPALADLATSDLPVDLLVPALDELAALAPGLLPGFLEVAAAARPERALVLAAALAERDAAPAAAALARHAVGLCGGDAAALAGAGLPAARLAALAGLAGEPALADAGRLAR
jgi:hypothetical protein